MKKLAFLLISLLFPLLAWAQPNMEPLPEQPDLLMAELEKIMMFQNQSDCIELYDRLKKHVKERRVQPEHFAGIVKLGNEMTKRKMKRYNFFKQLLSVMLVFIEDLPYSAKYLERYIDISIKVLADQPEGKTQNFEDYLKFSTYFWVNKNLYQAGSTGGHAWQATSQDFTIKYENKDLSIRYADTRLVCYNKQDSLIIDNARGTYFPLRDAWEGERGRVNWNQEGAMNAYCDIRNYTINARNADFRADDATLHHTALFKLPTAGKLTDRCTKRKVTGMNFPKFESKSRDVKIEDIGEGVSYVGGFTLEGATVRGAAVNGAKSTVYINDRKNRMVVRAVATNFDITKGERFVSDDAEVSVYFYPEEGRMDSIYHPNIRITYFIKDRLLELSRGSSIASKVPFFNSYQRMEINTPVIKWKIDEEEIKLGDDSQDAAFDSETYFSRGLLDKYQPGTTINYIIIFATYSNKLAQHAEEVAKYGETVEDDQGAVDESFCQFYPEACATHPKTGKLVPIDRLPKAEDSTAKKDEKPKINPLEINANTLARLLDKRVEGKQFLTPREFKEKTAPLQKKFGDRFRETNEYKNFCKTYVDVTQIERITSNPRPSHDIGNTMRLFLDMVADGFVIYNNEDTTVAFRPKLFHYARSANRDDKDYDYDRIEIKSVRGDSKKRDKNASLNITTGGIDVGNVHKFTLSESKQVYAQLDVAGNQVSLGKNRDMDFSGDLHAGFFQFTGRGFHFNYENFEVEMDTIDNIFIRIYRRFAFEELYDEDEIKDEQKGRYTNMRFYELDDDGNQKLSTQKVMLNSFISNTKGLLKVDVANNKSGRQKPKDNEKLPFFDSNAECGGYVFYDEKFNMQGEGTYPRESFYFKLEHFIRDSLLMFNPEGWKLKGEFHSSNIFPVITDEPLRVMFHDLSLGFEKETPKPKGYPIYLQRKEAEGEKNKGEGVFQGIVGVSNEGLLGKGIITYLGARIESNYIVFLPERFRADNVDSFRLDESMQDGVEFPKVDAKEVVIDWAPYNDSMYIESNVDNGEPFYMFEKGVHTLDGKLILTPEGLLGRGTFDWDEGTLKSNAEGDFVFGKNSVRSASTEAIIKSQGDEEAFAFQNDKVEAVVDFDKRYGDFISIEKDLSTDLPYNSYRTSLDRFHWEMDEKKIIIESSQGKAGFFLATEKEQDSLYFQGERADYDLNTGLLRIDGVEYILVADAMIFPKNEHVEITKRAEMSTLEDSRIVADTSNQNHQIVRARINILSRREYKASGYLEFNIEGHKDQEIKFDSVRAVQSGDNFVTQGSGSVSEDAQFYLDKKTRFRGDVNLSADSKDLVFKGYAKLTSDVLPVKEWFEIDSKIDKKNVGITYNQPQSPDGNTLHVGIYMNPDSGKVYPAIMAPKYDENDRSVFSVTGVVHYNVREDSYNFGDSAKVFSDTMIGKKMTVFERSSKVIAEGKFDFQKGFDKPGMPNVEVSAIGDFNFFLNKKSELLFDVALNVHIPLPNQVSDFLLTEMSPAQADLVVPIVYTGAQGDRFKRFLFEFVGAEKFPKIWKKVEEEQRVNLPADFLHTFFFSKVTLTWSEKTQSFISIGNLQLSCLAGKHLGQIVKGGIEIIPDPRGDILNIYFESPNSEWFFFTYQGDLMKTASSLSNYTNTITAMKAKDKKIKTPNGEMLKIDISNAGEYGAVKTRVSSGR